MLNEWLPVQSESRHEFVEIYNPSPLPVDLANIELVHEGQSFTPSPLSFLSGRGHAVWFTDSSQSFDRLPYALADSTGTIDLVVDDAMVDSVSYRNLSSGMAQGRSPDGGESIRFLSVPTPGATNASPIPIQTTGFQNGVSPTDEYAGTSDAWIRDGNNSDNNFGGGPRMDVDGSVGGDGEEWSLLRWDLTSLGGGQLVQAVSVTVTVSNPGHDYQFYAVTKDWAEDEVTWNQRQEGQPWDVPGTGETDRGAVVGTLSAGMAGEHTVAFNEAGIALVQSWLDSPETNYGLILFDAEGTDGIEIRTSEFDVPSQRPRLELTYRAALQGDFNRDFVLDESDIDLLCQALRDGSEASDFDLNLDGTLSESDLDEMIFEVLGTSYGDANLDGIFNSSDLVKIFQVGEFEDDVDGNSTWSDGDWNCDGDFTTSDLVVAFRAGGFVAAANSFNRVDAAAAVDQTRPRKNQLK